jgi:hypothetical protein
LWTISLMSKKMMSMLLTFPLVSLDFSTGRTVALSLGHNHKLSPHQPGLFLRNLIGRDAGRKKSAAWNSVHRLPTCARNITCRCIALLRLPHRWQHESRKLWTQPRKCQRPGRWQHKSRKLWTEPRKCQVPEIWTEPRKCQVPEIMDGTS